MDVFQYEETQNMIQVWRGKLSELQLPIQNPAQDGAWTNMLYQDRYVESARISVSFTTSAKFPLFSSNISKVIKSLMNLENHGDMFLEPSVCMDIPSSEGWMDRRTDVRVNPVYPSPPYVEWSISSMSMRDEPTVGAG